MSILLAVGVLAIVVLLMQNASLIRRIDVLQKRDSERVLEIKQLEKIIIKYGEKAETYEAQKTKGRGDNTR